MTDVDGFKFAFKCSCGCTECADEIMCNVYITLHVHVNNILEYDKYQFLTKIATTNNLTHFCVSRK